MSKQPLLKYMTKKLIYGWEDDSVLKIAKKMKKYFVGAIIILKKDHEIAGIITERDIVYKALVKDFNLKETTASKIMTKNVVTGTPDMTLNDIAKVFLNKKVKKLPIVDNKEIIGIITQTDLPKIILEK
ncbi:CBS domain-containing protein [Candidatus Woesearchaeota archaeon]|nr:CBS domain-containing protein [Candidatus Woesearchaeota archaeon]